jgi:plasmid replication initiation protein
VLRNELGISKTYKTFSLLKNNILIPAQKEINKKSKYKIYYDYSYDFYKNRQIRIKIFKKNR